MNDGTTHEDPAAIERDIRRTQDDMSRTVDRLGDQLTMKNLFNALLDKADENGVDAHYLVDGARRNPIALGLIAAGAIWLVSDKNSKFPSMPSQGKKPKAATEDELDLQGPDVHHRDYVTHMSALEIREGEDSHAYQRRRDLHRANYLMCERRHDEDESSFRQRLDDLTEKFREKRHAWSESASHTGTATSQRTRQMAQQASAKTQDLYGSNPIIGGIFAAAVGAALGSALPVSRQEQEKLGSVGQKARDMASDQIREKKDQLVDNASQNLQPEEQRSGPSEQERQPEFETAQSDREAMKGTTESGASDRPSSSEGPFIISERST